MVFACTKCKNEYDYNIPRWRCDCGAHLKLRYDVVFTKEDIKTERLNMWRYEKAYPMPYEEITVTYNEGLTPLVKLDWDNFNVRVKMEMLMPSCSFKDRGTVMAINYLKKHGIKFITEDSSGNAGASVSAYCALAGIKCAIYVPAGNSPGKFVQAKAYGAEVNPTPGTRDDVAKAAQVHAESYSGHNWHPMFEPGYKSVAYEIWEQSGFKAPDAVFTPCGGGGLTLGLVQGFNDLLKNKQISKVPKIYATQPENCNPIYRMFHGIEGELVPTPTIAEGTSIAKPVKIKEIVEGVRASGGEMVSVTDPQIKAALPVIWGKGVFLEPTSAIAIAAFIKLKEEGKVKASDDIVIMASGNGLKATEKIRDLFSEMN